MRNTLLLLAMVWALAACGRSFVPSFNPSDGGLSGGGDAGLSQQGPGGPQPGSKPGRPMPGRDGGMVDTPPAPAPDAGVPTDPVPPPPDMDGGPAEPPPWIEETACPEIAACRASCGDEFCRRNCSNNIDSDETCMDCRRELTRCAQRGGCVNRRGELNYDCIARRCADQYKQCYGPLPGETPVEPGPVEPTPPQPRAECMQGEYCLPIEEPGFPYGGVCIPNNWRGPPTPPPNAPNTRGGSCSINNAECKQSGSTQVECAQYEEDKPDGICIGFCTP